MRGLFLLAVLLLSTAAPAEARKAKRPRPEANPDFHVSIPVSEVDVEAAVARDDSERLAAYEIAVSSWAPTNFARPSFSPDVSGFSINGAPLLSIARVAPIRRYSNGAGFWWRAGAGYVNLRRQGQQYLGSGGGTYYLAEQTIGLASLRVGVEYRPLGLWGNQAQPYVSLQVAPTYAFGSASPFEKRVAALGFPFEAGAGLIFAPFFLRDLFGLGHGAVGLGAQYLFGSVDGSSMAGFGAQGFLSITL